VSAGHPILDDAFYRKKLQVGLGDPPASSALGKCYLCESHLALYRWLRSGEWTIACGNPLCAAAEPSMNTTCKEPQ